MVADSLLIHFRGKRGEEEGKKRGEEEGKKRGEEEGKVRGR